MRRCSPIVAVVVGAAAMAAGCASSSVSTGSPTAHPVGSGSVAGTPGSPLPPKSAPPTGPVATAAIGTPPPPGKHAEATVAGVTISCPDDAYGAPEHETPQPLARDVTVKAVVRCETVQRTYTGLGEWSVQLAEIADAGFQPLLAELRKPSQPRPSGLVCPAIGYVVPWFVLIRDDGTLLRPAMPTNECGRPSPGALAALNALDFRAVDAVRVQQTRSPASITSGCDQAFKDVISIEAAQPPAAAATQGGSVGDLASPPTSVLVCLYKAGPLEGGLRVGDLIKGATVTGDAAAQLVREAAIVGPLPAACQDADSFVVLHLANGPFDAVELGQCHRILINETRLGTASGQLLTALTTLLGVS